MNGLKKRLMICTASIGAAMLMPLTLSSGTQNHQSFSANVSKIEIEENEVDTVAVPLVDDTNPDITQSDIELLASLIYYEQGEPITAEDEERCYLTGCVVLNRVASDEFPDTIKDVIAQRGQYACANKVFNKGYYGDICYEIAEGLMTYGVEDVPGNLVFQAQFRQGSGTYKHIYNQYFCYR